MARLLVATLCGRFRRGVQPSCRSLPALPIRFRRSLALITKITGQLVTLADDALTLRLGGFEYQVLIPEFTRRQLQTRLDREISLHTIEYLEGNPMQGRVTPRLVGFLTDVEREFFDLFCSVDGVGVRKALRAMVRSVKETATAIEEQDAKFLSSLPGIGPATADRIIAKLRRKMPKFALIVAREAEHEAEVQPDVVAETFEVLRTLGHSESDARRLMDAALAAKRKYKDVESLLQAIYQISHGKPG
jgi:Holliday junction DNA helicase RuvA